MTGYFKCRRGAVGPGWVAWASVEPLTDGTSATGEPVDRELWFNSGETRAESAAKVKADVEREMGVDEWREQAA